MINVSTEIASSSPPPVPTARDRYHPGAFIEMLLSSIVGLWASLVLSIDAGTGFLSRTGTISYNLEGRPIPAENRNTPW